MVEFFREDAAFVTQYLNEILENGDQTDILITLRQMAKAFGGISKITETVCMNFETQMKEQTS